MRRFEAPSEREASTNSFSRIDKHLPAHDAGDVGPSEQADDQDHGPKPGFDEAPEAPLLVRTARGCDAQREEQDRQREHDVRRARDDGVESSPGRSPTQRPRSTPMTTAIPVAKNATVSDVRAPYAIRTKRSRPVSSTPRRYLGGAFASGPGHQVGADGRPNSSSDLEVDLVRCVAGPVRDERREDRHQEHQDDDHHAREREPVLAEVAPEDLPGAPADDRGRRLGRRRVDLQVVAQRPARAARPGIRRCPCRIDSCPERDTREVAGVPQSSNHVTATLAGALRGKEAKGTHRYRAIRARLSGSRLAPPTSAPSISGWAMNSRMFPGVTLPP